MKCLAGILFLMFVLVGVVPVQAASLYIDPGSATMSRGDALKLSVRLDTDEELSECVNALEGVVTFSGPIAPVDISTGDSIFTVWVEPPTLNEAQNQVTFVGGIPNGYCGRVDGDPRLTNNVFDIIIRADTTDATDGEAVVASATFSNQTFAYLNDGLGTQADLQTFPSNITVLPTVGVTILDPWTEEIDADTMPPQPFSIKLDRDSLAFSGKYYIAFNATDKQTGIDRYEVMEEKRSQFASYTWGGTNAPWLEVRSPYVLKDQSLNSTIRVRAIDKAGNEYVATYVPDEYLRTMSFEQYLTYLLLVMLVLAAAISSWFYSKRRTEKKRQAELDKIESTYTTISHH